jgi:hypothetical protein
MQQNLYFAAFFIKWNRYHDEFYWIKTHLLIKLFSRYIWDFPNTEKKVYLIRWRTYSKSYRMGFGKTRSAQRQSYFCIGKNIEAYPFLKN